ncbi:hypothetical protein V8G54_002857 [Vigna mungo]|uniref:Uncharacterized protein n=1 Tax=Vigna mungo TaxID=3915 RepID=A0AAQ3P9Z4_VIGMU
MSSSTRLSRRTILTGLLHLQSLPALTHLADEINRCQTITMLAIDNGAMNALLDKHLILPTLKNVLSLQVLTTTFHSIIMVFFIIHEIYHYQGFHTKNFSFITGNQVYKKEVEEKSRA